MEYTLVLPHTDMTMVGADASGDPAAALTEQLAAAMLQYADRPLALELHRQFVTFVTARDLAFMAPGTSCESIVQERHSAEQKE